MYFVDSKPISTKTYKKEKDSDHTSVTTIYEQNDKASRPNLKGRRVASMKLIPLILFVRSMIKEIVFPDYENLLGLTLVPLRKVHVAMA